MKLVDLEVVLHHQTDRAILASLDGDRAKAKWVPTSAIELELERRRAARRRFPRQFICVEHLPLTPKPSYLTCAPSNRRSSDNTCGPSPSF